MKEQPVIRGDVVYELTMPPIVEKLSRNFYDVDAVKVTLQTKTGSEYSDISHIIKSDAFFELFQEVGVLDQP